MSDSEIEDWEKKIKEGGTGFYATVEDRNEFNRLREIDMTRLSKDPFLPGFSMEHQMPDYTIYQSYIDREIEKKVDEDSKKYTKKNGVAPTMEEIEKLMAKHVWPRNTSSSGNPLRRATGSGRPLPP